MSITHSDLNIDINVTPAALPTASTGFGVVAFLAEDLSFGAGERFRFYLNNDQVIADSDLTAAAKAAGLVAFSQDSNPPGFIIANVDATASSETYLAALQDLFLKTSAPYGITMQSRVTADILAVAADIQARKKMLFVQTDATDLVSEFGTLSTSDQTGIHFHDSDVENYDVAAAIRFLSVNPDQFTTPASKPLSAVAEYTAATAQAAGFATIVNTIRNDDGLASITGNLVLPRGTSVRTYNDPGKAADGTPLLSVLTRHWLDARLREDVINVGLQYDAANGIIPANYIGEAILAGVLTARLDRAEALGKLVPGQRSEIITTSDPGAECLTAQVSVQETRSARKFKINVRLSVTEVI